MWGQRKNTYFILPLISYTLFMWVNIDYNVMQYLCVFELENNI